MTQPYVYWTLEAPLITIIGLYSNVEGTLDARGTYEQHRWLEDQLHTAAKSDCFILVAVHHPPYSLDRTHGGSPDIAAALDEAMRTTGVKPHAVVSGHVHDYQRFTRALDGRQIPYIVDGRGGYANDARLVHKLQKGDNGDPPEKGAQTPSEQDRELDLKIEGYDQANPGFLRATVTREELTIESFSMPFDGRFDDQPQDAVTVTRDGRLAGNGSRGAGTPRPRGGRRR